MITRRQLVVQTWTVWTVVGLIILGVALSLISSFTDWLF